MLRGEDGNTAYQRLRGRPLRSKEVTDPTDHRVRYNLRIFLGLDRTSCQYTSYDPVDGSLRFAMTAVRSPNEETWKVEQLQEVKILPLQAQESRRLEVISTDKPVGNLLLLDLTPLNLDDAFASSRPTSKPLDGREVALVAIMKELMVLIAHRNRIPSCVAARL